MTAYTGTPALPPLLSGDVPSAATDWAAIAAALHGLTDARTPYTPVWSSFGTLPVLGNGTLTGKYTQAGKWVVFGIELIPGSTTTYGTSFYTFTTPTAAFGTCCAAFFEDNSTGFRYSGVSTIESGVGSIGRTVFANGTAGFSSTSPVTVATSDIFRVAGVYEAA